MGKQNQISEIEVSLSENHLKRVSQCDPTHALVELIWNGLDAGATKVDVIIDENPMGGINEIKIKDNGSGISAEILNSAFGSLGDSHKTKQNVNSRGHRVHGSLGEGRFKAYSLGNKVQWTTKSEAGRVTEILGNVTNIRKFSVASKKDDKHPIGTHFTAINGYGAELKLPSAEKLAERLSVVFAPKLLSESDIKVSIGSHVLNPESRISAQLTQEIKGFKETQVKIVVWKPSKSKTQELVWCDDGFNSRGIDSLDVFSNVDCSVFIASPEVARAVQGNTFELRDVSDLAKIREIALEIAHAFVNKTTKEKIAKTVNELQERGVYPYEGKPKSELDSLERNVFNVCATKVIESIPAIATGSKDRQKLTLHLLRTAIESSPSSVQHVFEKILNLPKEHIEELSGILSRVSIMGLIKLGKIVVDRRDFLTGLEHILFEKESRKRLLERTQLHKILEPEAWIFGEEYSLGCSDKTLDDVLAHHRALLKHGSDDAPATLSPGEKLSKIPDLVLSRQYKFGAADQYKHLVVELKRPSVKIGFDEKTQIEKYASAVSSDPRFDKTKTRWIFVAVSSEVKEEVTGLIQSSDGRIDPGKNPNIEIYVKPWSTIIQAAKGRMDYLWQRTEAQSSTGDGVNYLKEKYPDIMSNLEEAVARSTTN